MTNECSIQFFRNSEIVALKDIVIDKCDVEDDAGVICPECKETVQTEDYNIYDKMCRNCIINFIEVDK